MRPTPRDPAAARAGLLALVLVAACAAPPQAPDWPGPEIAATPPPSAPYRVAPGDELRLEFPFQEGWGTTLLVRPDGRVSVPLVGEVAVGGRTVAEIEAEVEAGLEGRVKVVDVLVDVVSLHARSVYVGGEVLQPGPVELDAGRIALLDALLSVRGPIRDTAAMSHVLLARVGPDGLRHTWRVDLSDLATPREPIWLVPGDVVLVPPRGIVGANDWIDRTINRNLPGANLWGFLAVVTR